MNDDARFVKPGAEGLLSPLMSWLNHPQVSEILINKPQEVFVEVHGCMTRHEVPELTSLYLHRLFQMIANESQQRLDEAHPLLSGNLYNGYRVQLIIPPISLYHTLTIRKTVLAHWSLEDYATNGFYRRMKTMSLNQEFANNCQDKELLDLYRQQRWGDFIKNAVVLRKNIVISGGTSSGKTTFIKACLEAIPAHERIILLEDTRELSSSHLNQVSLLASKGSQGKAQVDMQGLLEATLRLRPDRLIMGEIRGKEIMDFVMACSTGHEGSITSIHANNPQIAMQRMVQLYKQNNVPSMRDEEIRAELNQVVDIIIQLGKVGNERVAQYCYYKDAQLIHDLSEVAA
ncbi:P-type DNA transfer ATPase VirB11 [Legionella sp.]|uniref:P-type DNA transfer ATPase VirB11 n=1 Tax=Legionella sp. TaxID=459 RepID=UPI003C8D24D9